MPLKPGTLIAVKEGVVELIAEILAVEAETSLIEAIRARMLEHQADIMTDPAILDPDSVSVASVFLCRHELTSSLKAGLSSLGLSEATTQASAAESHSLFARLGRGQRAQLSRCRLVYQRTRDLSPRWAALETELLEEAPEGPIYEAAEALLETLGRGAARHLGLRLSFDRAGLEAIEDHLLRERAQRPGKLVLQPALVRALAALAGVAIVEAAPETQWSDDDEDTPLHIRGSGGLTIVSDPVGRVIDLITRGRQALLTDYADGVVRQSLTRAART
ncbi:MAG: hypothetical protein U1E65_00745 [Myxococcota bacterium]